MTQKVDLSAFHPPEKIGAKPLPVYVSKEGDKPLVILHELPGMSPSFIDYCNRMACERFKVYMPLMYEEPGTEMGKIASLAYCTTRTFRDLFAPDTSNARPFTAWLMELLQKISDDHPNTKIGAIGMCLTGGFVISAIAKPQVAAVAACHPTAPFFFNIHTLGLSDAERESIIAGKEGKAIPCVKAYRYERDILCRETHMNAAKQLLRTSLDRSLIFLERGI